MARPEKGSELRLDALGGGGGLRAGGREHRGRRAAMELENETGAAVSA